MNNIKLTTLANIITHHKLDQILFMLIWRVHLRCTKCKKNSSHFAP